jgi:enolase
MTDTAITFVRGRRVWDSRGRPTVEAEVVLVVLIPRHELFRQGNVPGR